MRGSLLVSGAYVARDQKQKENADFLRNTLKVDAYAPVTPGCLFSSYGMNTALHLYTELNPQHYAVTHADCLIPLPEAFSTLLYTPTNYSAAVAYQGKTTVRLRWDSLSSVSNMLPTGIRSWARS